MQVATRVVAGLLACTIVVSATPAGAFDLADVSRRAEEIAKEPYRDRQTHVPAWMLKGVLSYDQWRDIRFRPDQALWRREKLPFQVQLFHPGLFYDRTIDALTFVLVNNTGTSIRPLYESVRAAI